MTFRNISRNGCAVFLDAYVLTHSLKLSTMRTVIPWRNTLELKKNEEFRNGSFWKKNEESNFQTFCDSKWSDWAMRWWATNDRWIDFSMIEREDRWWERISRTTMSSSACQWVWRPRSWARLDSLCRSAHLVYWDPFLLIKYVINEDQ